MAQACTAITDFVVLPTKPHLTRESLARGAQDRPRGESYLNYAFRNNWLPAGWMVELSRDGTPIYINMANSSASTTPPVQPPYWMTQPTLGTQYANNPVWTYSDKEWRRFDQAVGIASAAAEHPSASDVRISHCAQPVVCQARS